MLVEPWTTWLLVSTSPEEVRIMPVPAAGTGRPMVWITVLMSTTAGLTLLAIAWALDWPDWPDEEPIWGTVRMGACTEPRGPPRLPLARLRPMPTPPAKSSSPATMAPASAQIAVDARPRRRPPAGSAVSGGGP